MIHSSFVYEALPQRIIFGNGLRHELSAELDRLGCKSAFVICTPEQQGMARELINSLGSESVIFSEAAMHTPVSVTNRALQSLSSANADVLVAIGGGSAIGLAKALALRTDLPQIAVPTTYAGSEATPIIGETENGEKQTQRTLKVLPEVVIYDPELTHSLPVSFSVTSGINAMAHAIEALYASNGNPIISRLAEEGIRALKSALPKIAESPSDAKAREEAAYGAWLCGTCLGSVGMALHHKVCHVLGGTFDLPHAPTHTVVLPHALAYNAPAIPQEISVLARIFDSAQPWLALHTMIKALGGPASLQAIGMRADGIDHAAHLIQKNAYQNPRAPEIGAIERMLKRAFDGEAPKCD